MQDVHVVAGPTAAGKTKFALELAKKVNGVLINADSRQIYKYLDIGTNKGNIEKKDEVLINDVPYPVFELEDSGINIHLLSFLDPDQEFNAFSFRDLVYELILQVDAAAQTPIIVGGTGFYIDAVINPQKYAVETPEAASQKLDLRNLSLSELQQKLPAEILDSMNNSDRRNPVRLVSRILSLQSNPIAHQLNFPKYNFVKHYITKDMEELTARINKRVEQMWREGLTAEVENVLELGFDKGSAGLSASGYPEVIKFLEGKLTKVNCIRAIQTAHRQVAKKQITWFKKYFA